MQPDDAPKAIIETLGLDSCATISCGSDAKLQDLADKDLAMRTNTKSLLEKFKSFKAADGKELDYTGDYVLTPKFFNLLWDRLPRKPDDECKLELSQCFNISFAGFKNMPDSHVLLLGKQDFHAHKLSVVFDQTGGGTVMINHPDGSSVTTLMAAEMKRADEAGGACAKAIKDDGLALADDCRIDCILFAGIFHASGEHGYSMLLHC